MSSSSTSAPSGPAGSSGSAGVSNPSMSVPSSSVSWQLPRGAIDFFPTMAEFRLVGESNYLPWTKWMENGYIYSDLWELVQGREKDDGSVEWRKKDTSAKSFLYQSISDPLLAKIQHCATTADAWNIFASHYGQIGMGSVIIWMRAII